ncbi:MAG: hypothetical protein K0S07_1159 [Chlamydiales bacterium]|nr:hypothetical protein [Chlamydiales bacterium]
MSLKAKTKEERFLTQLSHLQVDKESVSCFEVGRWVGMNERSVKNAVNILAQCNFVKKRGGDLITLTALGQEHVDTLV